MLLIPATLVALVSALQSHPPADGAVAFQQGDHICLVGNELAARLQHDGWFETLLRERVSDIDLSIRDLGFAGDEVVTRLRVEGFGAPDEWLTRCQASVVLAFFGFNESFHGDGGLESFRRDLGAYLDHLQATSFDGKSPPRIVLFGSIPNEDLANPLLPDGRETNARLAKYHEAMAAVAREKKITFVDLFTPMAAAFAAHVEPLTVDGMHLTDEGDHELARILVDALCGPEVAKPALPTRELKRRETLRAAVLDKDELWYQRYQTTDGYNIYGGRASLAYTDGQSNFTVLQREMAILDAQAASRDRRLFALANGRDLPLDESAVPPKILVKTNIPGPLPGGAHEFLDATAAIDLMHPATGMQVHLFADEQQFPELAKPVQMAFDTKGRLWVAAWPTYPHWEPQTPRSDKLLILEDTDHDGRADVCKVFADGLVNPTGFEFWNGGVIVAQAPHLLFLKDTDGDDKADVTVRLLDGLSTADSHHTANSFVIGPDGALYLQEGTFMRSQIETVYGLERNHDACVWRFEPRTFRMERYIAYDFANPHGHVFDRWGQEFVTDGTGNVNYYALPFSGHLDYPEKHAGYFPFFAQRSRPCPATEILSSRLFPASMQGDYLDANVIGFQGIFQYHVDSDESGFRASEVEPLVSSSDPRFRPVDVEIGPDGAVWFLDWYNPIIGHMQHNLRDPNRDHSHGRVYWMAFKDRPLLTPKVIAGRPIPELLELLKEPEDRVRYRTRIELSGRDSKQVVAAVRTWVAKLDPADLDFEHHRLEALWLEQQHAAVDDSLLELLLHSKDERVRAAAASVLRWNRRSAHDPIGRFVALARDASPRVRLEAVVAASEFHNPTAPAIVFEAMRHATDKFLDYAISESLRALDGEWRRALVAGTLELHDNPKAVAFLVERASERELSFLPRIEPVLAALVARHATDETERRSALLELAKLRGSTLAAELLRAMERVDGSQDLHARHVQSALGELLLEVAAKKQVSHEELAGLAARARLPETQQFALAACIVADGTLDRAWNEATNNARGIQQETGGVLSLLGSLQHLPTALAATAWSRVEPLLFAKQGGEATKLTLGQGLFVSYFEVRLRTATREGFDLLTPAATLVMDHVGVDVPGIVKSDSFALRFQATLEIATRGEYEFTLESDDGSRLWIDGQLVVDNDLDHGMTAVTGRCSLGAGAHSFDLCHFDQGGAEGLKLSWSGPGIARQAFPANVVTPVTGELLRAAAIRAAATLPGHEAEKIVAATRLLKERACSAESVELLASVPLDAIDGSAARAAVEAITGFATSVSTEQRTRADVQAALDLGERLATRLPEHDATLARAELAQLRGSTILIRTVPHQMLYDRREFSVAAGQAVAVVFQNDDLMPHNLVVGRPGSLEAIGSAAEAMATDPKAQARSFVPDSPDVLFQLKLLMPGESATLRFVAPTQLGDHPFVCTFPGHWRVMNGVMHVVAVLDAAAAAKNVAAPLAGATSPVVASSRAFIQMWTLDDLKPALASGWERGRSSARGHSVFLEAGCVKCHLFHGEGVKSAPDLSAVAAKYRDAELLKQILEPSAVIQEGFENHIFMLDDERVVVGRIVKQDAKSWQIAENLQEPEKLTTLEKGAVQSEKKSALSAMPTGLLVTFTKEEILDLVAWLQAAAPNAAKPASGTKQ